MTTILLFDTNGLFKKVLEDLSSKTTSSIMNVNTQFPGYAFWVHVLLFTI